MFKAHRVRASFYHIGVGIFLASALCAWLGLISGFTYSAITTILFVVDYLAEMYDPHPDNQGAWFKAHFHRFFDDSGED